MEKIKLREAAVAGQFYAATASGIRNQIEPFIDQEATKREVIACMLPHAGYMYSGRVAVETVSQVKVKDKVILLGPNHTGYGERFSIMTEGIWQTPLGEIEIDSSLANKILEASGYLKKDTLAHRYEHSLEVELPILQYFKPDFKIVPITILSDEVEALKEIGRTIASSIQDSNLKNMTLLLASSDMTHYEPQLKAKEKDKEAIEAILELNADKLIEKVRRLNISMCGYAPVIVMLEAAKQLGATKSKLIKYQTSGEVTGDTSSVVGYAGIIIY